MQSSIIVSLDLSKKVRKMAAASWWEKDLSSFERQEDKKTEPKPYFKKREHFGRRFKSFPAAVQADSETFSQ